MLRVLSFLIACLTFIFFSGETKADLVIVVDQSNETLLFTGSDSGISSAISSFTWETGMLSVGGAGSVIAPIEFDNGESGALFFTSTGIALDVFADNPNEPVFLSTDNSIPLSFSSLTDGQTGFFESQIGNSLSLSVGTEFNAIRIVAIPEPTSAVLLYSAFALVAVRRRRR